MGSGQAVCRVCPSEHNLILEPPLISQLDQLLQRVLERDQCAVFLCFRIISVPDIDCPGLLFFGTNN